MTFRFKTEDAIDLAAAPKNAYGSHPMISSSTQCAFEAKCVSVTKNKKTAGSTDGPFVTVEVDALDFALAV